MARNKAIEQSRKELAAAYNRLDALRRIALGLYEKRGKIEREIEANRTMDPRLLEVTNAIQQAESEYGDLERRINALRASLVKQP